MYQSLDNKKVLNGFFYQHQSTSDMSVNKTLRDLADKDHLIFIDRQSIVCNTKNHQCDVFDDQGQSYYLDSHHWTPQGRKLFGAELINTLPLLPQ